MNALDLNGMWKMRPLNGGDWLPAEVPGSVYADLLRNGRMEDPFYRDYETAALRRSDEDYEYERSFTVDPEMLSSDLLALRFEGLDTLADIYVNGELAGSANNMHRTYELDVKSRLRLGSNDLRIVFSSPTRHVAAQMEKNPIWGVDIAIEGFSHLRKAHSMFGWDWGPQLPDMGIWRNVSLIFGNVARLDDIRLDQEHKDGKVTLLAAVSYEPLCSSGTEGLSARLRLTAPDGKAVYEEECAFSAGKQLLDWQAPVAEPQIWWPNGYGSQPLYTVEATLLQDGAVLDGRSYTIGLRTMGLHLEKDQWGESFAIQVNGVPIFIHGANYIPEDNILSRYSSERTERLLLDCVDANYNCIRVWGGGIYPDETFYDLCDRLGLVVWQDFMFACAVYDMSGDFAGNVRQEAIQQVKRLRHRACLALWCGNNEIETALVNWDFPKTAKYRSDYIRLFEIMLPDIIRAHDPARDYWPSSPSSGGGFDDPDNENRGDTHYWKVWHGQRPFTHYRKYHFRFCSEFGFQSFPGLKTIQAFTLPEDHNIFSYVMEKHQKNGAANGKILYYMAETFKYPKDFPSLLLVSQMLQAEAIKYGVEHWRRNRGRCMGSIYWQLNDCWPGASWSSIDYFGRWKALHYFARRFYAPVLLSAMEEGDSVELHVTNERREPFRGTIRWRLMEADGTVLRTGEADAAVEALCAKLCVALDFAPELEGDCRRRRYVDFALIEERSAVSVSEGTVLFVKPKHFEFANPQLDVNVMETETSFELVVRSASYAKYVTLDLTEADGVFSDNVFDLSAGDGKVVQLPKSRLSRPLSLVKLKSQLTVSSAFHWF
ncbi:MAG: glycoside hydrolase family 2 sugar binding protein [Paenibacillaceae bacterium]|jgi:beta-mannosidase|nr:glycoside hydrolase family 2 sugar binding protein [Paenibacillaceae bacterium]